LHFYCEKLKNYTCDQKPGPVGLDRPPGGWRCKKHRGWNFSRGSTPSNSSRQLAPCLWLNWAPVTCTVAEYIKHRLTSSTDDW